MRRPVDDQILEALGRHQQMVVVCHEAPDGDAVGSALALTAMLRDMGREVFPLVPRPYLDQMWEWLPGWHGAGGVNRALPKPRPGLIFVVDAGSVERPGEAIQLTADMEIVNIDHHQSNPGYGTINLVEPESPATAMVLYELFQRLERPITPEIALYLYTGLFSDTGGFRHENTTARVLEVGADLVRHGADPAMVALRLFRSRPLRALRLQAAVMAEMKFESDGVVWAPVTQQMLGRTGAALADSEGIIDMLNGVDEMRAAILFKEQQGGAVRVSLRSREPLDAEVVVAAYNGGGHARAAGCELPGPLNDAVPHFLGHLRQVARETGAT